jgi:hypothetical protein
MWRVGRTLSTIVYSGSWAPLGPILVCHYLISLPQSIMLLNKATNFVEFACIIIFFKLVMPYIIGSAPLVAFQWYIACPIWKKLLQIQLIKV